MESGLFGGHAASLVEVRLDVVVAGAVADAVLATLAVRAVASIAIAVLTFNVTSSMLF